MSFYKKVGMLVLLSCILPSTQLLAQSADEAARELANPNTALSSFNIKSTITSFKGGTPGAADEAGFVTLIQPILPFPITESDKIIFRPAVPLISSQPFYDTGTAQFDTKSGLGDIGFDLIYASTSATGVLSGYGIIGTLPTATDNVLGKNKWSVGPELFIGKVNKTNVIGALAGHQWSFAGNDKVVNKVSLTTINVFAAYLPGGGWSVGSFPIITKDHENNQWTVPVNLAVGKTVILSGRPWKFNLGLNYYVKQADAFGPDWSVDFTITPVIQNFMMSWFK